MIRRYVLAVIIAVAILLGNDALLSEFDLYAPAPHTSPELHSAEVLEQRRAPTAEYLADLDRTLRMTFIHNSIVWFVATLIGGFVAQRRFSVAATLIAGAAALVYLDIARQLQDAFPGSQWVEAGFAPEVVFTLPIFVGVAGALAGEWLYGRSLKSSDQSSRAAHVSG
ncbi:MAG: hypothetical protein AAFX44_16000 [Pseudomonadota bacterium]